jgi:hypothetical protein
MGVSALGKVQNAQAKRSVYCLALAHVCWEAPLYRFAMALNYLCVAVSWGVRVRGALFRGVR